jgi:hypothetical protein
MTPNVKVCNPFTSYFQHFIKNRTEEFQHEFKLYFVLKIWPCYTYVPVPKPLEPEPLKNDAAPQHCQKRFFHDPYIFCLNVTVNG